MNCSHIRARNVPVRTFVLSAFCIAILLFMLEPFHIVYADEASSKIEAAENAITDAFKSVVEAEEIGANITDVSTRLNQAESLLQEAKIEYKEDRFDEAILKSDASLATANAVIGEASDLKGTFRTASQNNLILTVVFSSIGAAVFLTILVYAWRSFKRAYFKSLLKMRPELTTDGT